MKIYALKFLDICQDKLADLCLLISPEKRNKIQQFVNKQDKIRTLIGEILIRTILVEQLGLENKHLTFEQNPYGKPYLKKHPAVNFNLSHSSNFVVCAFDGQSVGIDIEEVINLDYENIAKNFFTVSELNYIFKHSPDIRLNKFYEIWTLKESYLKWCGQGLSTRLQSFSIEIDQDENIAVVVDREPLKQCVLKRFDLELNYKMALCSLGSGNKKIPDEVIMVEQNSLIYNYTNLS